MNSIFKEISYEYEDDGEKYEYFIITMKYNNPNIPSTLYVLDKKYNFISGFDGLDENGDINLKWMTRNGYDDTMPTILTKEMVDYGVKIQKAEK